MAGPIIAITENIFGNLDPALGQLARLNPTIRMAKSPSAEDILAVAKDADAILVTYAKLPRELLLQLTNCKAIGRFGLGVDNIDLPTCKEKGIKVNYVPDYCIHEVSDHTVALLLSLIRKIPLANRLVQAGRWEMPAVKPITRIKGTVLGLLGFGHIPRLVAPKAKAFGIEVIAYDPYCDKKLFADLGVASVEFDDLLKRSDYISVHAPHDDADARPAQRRRLRQDQEGRLYRQHRARTADRRGGADRRARVPARSAAPRSTWSRSSRWPRIRR